MKIYQITYVPDGESDSKVISVGANDMHDAFCAFLDRTGGGDDILNICPAGDLLIAGSYDYNELED